MVRIPLGNEKSARLEVRPPSSDSNPYLWFYTLISAGLKGMYAEEAELKHMEKDVYGGEVGKLPGEIYTALGCFEKSEFMKEIMGEKSHKKYIELKERAADRCPRALGKRIKSGEVLYHHEVTNQLLWADF
jgi:glutamine synthetase